MSVSVRIPTILRTYTTASPRCPPTARRWRGARLARAQLPGHQGPDPRRAGRDPAVRQRLRRQRRRPVPRGSRTPARRRAPRSRSSRPSPAAELRPTRRVGGHLGFRWHAPSTCERCTDVLSRRWPESALAFSGRNPVAPTRSDQVRPGREEGSMADPGRSRRSRPPPRTPSAGRLGVPEPPRSYAGRLALAGVEC